LTNGDAAPICYSVIEQLNKAAETSEALTSALCEALLSPRDAADMAKLLADLCTPAEIRSLAERWHVARLLDTTDLSYRDIHDATGVSTTTIVRVARFLRQEPHLGYRRALDSLKAAETNAG
jgi:TrpR-related protein YerC/YecD